MTYIHPRLSNKIGYQGPASFMCWVYGSYSSWVYVHCVRIMCSHLIWAIQFAIIHLMAGFLNICVLLLLFIFLKRFPKVADGWLISKYLFKVLYAGDVSRHWAAREHGIDLLGRAVSVKWSFLVHCMGFAKLSVFVFVNSEGTSMLMLIFKVKACCKLTQYNNSLTLLPLHVTPPPYFS